MREGFSGPMFSRAAPGTDVGNEEGGDREALLAWLQRRLREDLADPVRVGRSRDRVTLMRGIEVRVNRRRRDIVVRGRRGPAPDDWLYGMLKLDRPLAGPHWACAWWWCVQGDLPDALREVGDGMLSTELPGLINRVARQSGLLPAARGKAVASLRLNRRLLGWVRAMSPDGVPHTDQYVQVWRAARHAKVRVHESPRLWPLYGVLGLSPACDLDEVKRRMRAMGLTRGGWKVLCRNGRELWWPCRRCHEFARHPARAIALMANLVAAAGRRGLPPASLRLAIGSLQSIYRGSLEANVRRLLPPFVAGWRWLEAVDRQTVCTSALRRSLDIVLMRWMIEIDPPKVPPNASWAWFVRVMGSGREALLVRNRIWPWFGRSRRIGTVTIVPLCTLRAVHAAGVALRNCMARVEYRDDICPSPLFVVRDMEGREVAMFDAYRGDAEPREIRGRYNRGVDDDLRAIACMYLGVEKHGVCGGGQ